MDTHSSLVGSLYSRDGIPLQQFQDGHGRCFFFAISGTGATQRSRSPKLVPRGGTTSVAMGTDHGGCRVNVMWMPCQWMVQLFNSTLPFAIRSQKGDASKTGWENSRLSGAGGWLQNLTHIFFRHPGSITGFWVQKKWRESAIKSHVDVDPPEIHTCAPCLGERRPTLLGRSLEWEDGSFSHLEDHSRDLDKHGFYPNQL